MLVHASNESNTANWVSFDDLKITHQKSPVIQADDYYPFGLTFNSYQRESSVKNNYLYNEKELQDELNLGWLDYGARMYMPEIGRWGVIDPLTFLMSSSSPYSYTFNNPINLTDSTGMIPDVPSGKFKERDKEKVLGFDDDKDKSREQIYRESKAKLLPNRIAECQTCPDHPDYDQYKQSKNNFILMRKLALYTMIQGRI